MNQSKSQRVIAPTIVYIVDNEICRPYKVYSTDKKCGIKMYLERKQECILYIVNHHASAITIIEKAACVFQNCDSLKFLFLLGTIT